MGRMSTGERLMSVCATPMGARSKATSEAHMPRHGPSTAPMAVYAMPARLVPMRSERPSMRRGSLRRQT